MLTVIVVEDEPHFREALCEFLTLRGFRAVGVESERDLDAALCERGDAIVVLDVNLGRESGFAIARRLRGRNPQIGLIMLTARHSTDDLVAGLGAGADTYLTKPVDFRVLEAVIGGLSRRLRPPAAGVPDAEGPAAAWTFDAAAWRLTAPNGRAAALTANETAFLALLIAHPGTTVGRTAIAAALGWASEDQIDSRIATLVNRLRRKVEQDTGYPLPVRAIRAVGYAFIAPLAGIGANENANPG